MTIKFRTSKTWFINVQFSILVLMATPIAHCLAGLSIYCLVGPAAPCKRPGSVISLLAVLLVAANLPDLDFIPGLLLGSPEIFHREFSHSLAFCLLSSAALLIYLKLARVQAAILISALWLAAMSSHLAIDWLSLDVSEPSGIELLWPISGQRFMSDHVLFLGARRNDIFSEFTIGYNLFAATWEMIVLMPVLALCKYLSGHLKQLS